MDEHGPLDGGAEGLREVVVSLALESWRFTKVFERAVRKLDAGEQGRFDGQFRWFLKRVEEGLAQAGLRLVNLEGHPFEAGAAATPLNIDEFEEDDLLVVDQMMEPVIMGENGVVRMGTVLLRKVES